MISQIAVPIYRAVTLEQQLLENHQYPDISSKDHPNNILAEMNADALAELSERLDDGFTILDKYDTTNRNTTYRAYILYKAESQPASQPAANHGSVSMAHSITKKQTWSKTANQYFEYWKLDLANGRFVNVFNHPDMARNTYKLVQSAGWTDLWEQFNLDEIYVLETPLPVVVSDDKEWLKLEQIVGFMDFTNVAPFMYKSGENYESESDEE